MEENVKVNNALSSEPTGLLKEIINKIDCRNKVREYLDSLEIPDYFFACMFGELVKIFGSGLIQPNPFYCLSEEEQCKAVENGKLPSYSENYSYRDQIDFELTYEGGTGGWYNALAATCWLLDMDSLLNVYNKLSWMNSDYFDEWVSDKIVEYLFDRSNRDQSYAEFLKKKRVL